MISLRKDVCVALARSGLQITPAGYPNLGGANKRDESTDAFQRQLIVKPICCGVNVLGRVLMRTYLGSRV